MTETAKRDFSAAAKTWDDNPMRVKLAQAVVDAIMKQVDIPSSASALDYGAGTGLVTLGLQPYVNSILAADSAPGMLEMLNQKAADSGLANVKTMLLNLEKDPILDERFDLITASMTMHHIADLGKMVERLSSMLKPGGYLAIADLDPDNGEFHADPTGVMHNGIDRGEMMKFFTAQGLNDVTETTAHTLTREVEGKGMRDFTVFLITGRKA